MKTMFNLIKLAEYISADLILNDKTPDLEITGVATLSNAKQSDLSFYTNTKYRDDLLSTQAGVIITSPKHAELITHSACLVVNNAHVAYAKLATLFDKSQSRKSANIHPTAIIGHNCNIADSVIIGAYVVIGDNVTVGSNVIIKSGVVVGDDCTIGADTLIYPKAVIYDGVRIGKQVIIHAGAIIGSDGFGFAFTDEKTWLKVPQLGAVVVGDNVEIGANTTIDRGAIEDTIIEDGVKLDNQIQIAHNVIVGKHSIIAAQVGIAGSSKIGQYCAFGGGSAISGHISVAPGVKLAGFSTVGQDITEPGFYASGTGPVLPYLKWRRATIHFENLDKYIQQLKQLVK